MMKIQIAVFVGVLALVMVTATEEVCTDKNGESYCRKFKDVGYCEQYRLNGDAYTRCAFTCDLCNGPPCEDLRGEKYCASKEDECDMYPHIRNKLCRKTCGTC